MTRGSLWSDMIIWDMVRRLHPRRNWDILQSRIRVTRYVSYTHLMSKELSNIKEVKSRGADVVVFIKESIVGDLAKEYEIFTLPDMQDEFMVLPASVALQLLAYYVSSDKGFDVDKPRNLAKMCIRDRKRSSRSS